MEGQYADPVTMGTCLRVQLKKEIPMQSDRELCPSEISGFRRLIILPRITL